MTDQHNKNKQALALFRAALYDYDYDKLKQIIIDTFAEDVLIQFCHPFETLSGRSALLTEIYAPLVKAIPDLERRDTIMMAGGSNHSSQWVGCCGYYTGSFEQHWLDIPPTGHQVSMRFHEFYRFEAGKIVEVQAVWDIPE